MVGLFVLSWLCETSACACVGTCVGYMVFLPSMIWEVKPLLVLLLQKRNSKWLHSRRRSVSGQACLALGIRCTSWSFPLLAFLITGVELQKCQSDVPQWVILGFCWLAQACSAVEAHFEEQKFSFNCTRLTSYLTSICYLPKCVHSNEYWKLAANVWPDMWFLWLSYYI